MFDVPVFTTSFGILPELRESYRKSLEEQGGHIREGMKVHLASIALCGTAGSLVILHLLRGGTPPMVILSEVMIALSCLFVDLSCIASFGLWGSAYNTFAKASRQSLPVLHPKNGKAEPDAILAESFAFPAVEWELIFFVFCLPSFVSRNRNLMLFFRHRTTKQLILLENASAKHGFRLLANGDMAVLMLKHTLCEEYAIREFLSHDERLCPYLTREQLESLYQNIFHQPIGKEPFAS